MRNRTLIPALAATLLLLVSCGDGDGGGGGDEGATNMGADDYPTCSDVWVEGDLLPDDFEGCMEGDTIVDVAFTECADGERELRIHQTAAGEDQFFSLTGEPIEVYTDEAKSAAYEDCQPPS